MARFLRRVVLGIFATLAVARAVAFLVYVAWEFDTPLEAFPLESQMVHLSWRVQEGRALYPPWRDGPHVTNFFSPGYFVAIGLLGALFNADLGGLFRIGRTLTVGAGLGAAVAVGVVIGRRYGRGAGIVAGACALGAVPMHGFGLMARPDVTADLLGFVGFLLAAGGSRAGRTAGAVLLVLAVLTKQTTGIYLLAAVLVLLRAGRWRPACTLLAGCALALGAIVATVTAVWEPHCAAGLLGESRTPSDLENWRIVMWRVLVLSPDLLLLPAAGLVCWSRGRTRDPTPAVLAVVVAVATLATLLKMGSDLNYFLGLRLVASLGAGTLWGAAAGPEAHPGRGAALLLGALALWLGVVQAQYYASQARWNSLFRYVPRRSPRGLKRHDPPLRGEGRAGDLEGAAPRPIDGPSR